MNRRFGLLAAGVAGALAIASPLAALPQRASGYNTSDDHVTNCDGGDLTIHAPDNLWPPNHKYYTDLFVKADDANDGNVTLTTDGTHDQYDGDTEANGSGHTADDITTNDQDAQFTDDSSDTQPVAAESGEDVVQTDWEARAERSGHFQEGRTYTLHALAEWSDGSSCQASYSFNVPHDMGVSDKQ